MIFESNGRIYYPFHYGYHPDPVLIGQANRIEICLPIRSQYAYRPDQITLIIEGERTTLENVLADRDYDHWLMSLEQRS